MRTPLSRILLAFGLGGREVARELSAGRYLRGSYEVGQRISFDEVSGQIVSFETAATVLRDNGGDTVRVPNNRLLSSVLTVHESPREDPDQAPAAG